MSDDLARIRLLLVEDHKMVRQGLVALLQDACDIQIVGEAGDGPKAIELAAAHTPDVALMDINLPGMNGIEAGQKIRERSPSTRLLFLTMYDDEHIIQALRYGGAGYVLKDADAGTLIEAIRRVSRGESYLSPEVSQTIIRRVINDDVEPTGQLQHTNLTARERQILQLIAESKTNREISEKLSISIKTVQTHRANLMNKLDIHDQTSLVKYAIRHGLVTLD